MPSAWRIVHERHAGQAFSGEGARLYGGRWNSPGIPVIYTAHSRSLAALEMLVHLDAPQLLDHYVLIEVSFPASAVEAIDANSLPPDWREFPAPESTQSIGNRWLQQASSPILRIPSVLIPEEHNFLLNPAHSGFTQLRIAAAQSFRFDPRLKG